MLEAIIERWKEANPLSCHYLGIHEYDGRLPDLSEKFINKRIIEIKEDLNQLSEIETPKTKLEKFEIELVITRLKQELFELEEHQEFKESPIDWIYPLTLVETSYTVRNFAPLDERLKSIIEFEREIPNFLNTAVKQLDKSLPKAKISMGLQFLSGILNFYKDQLIGFVTKTDSEELIDEWSEVNINAVEAIESFLDTLKNEYLPNAHDDFALGKKFFMTILSNTEGVNISYEDLLIAGEKDLERNYQALMDLEDEVPDRDMNKFIAKMRYNYPEPDKLVEEASATLDRTRLFLEQTGVVGLPSDEHCEVIPTPEFARSFAFAAMNTPGPFEAEAASEAYYWITPPNPDWPEERVKQFMTFFNRPFLEVVTIHEVYPGHFVQLLYNKQAESDIAKMMARSTSMIEGWAHYAEEMIINQGYEIEDLSKLELKVGQLFGALVRNCRYIAAVKMHCESISVEEAKQMFIEKAFMPEPTAEIEANRGTIDPMYLNYTLGKLMIKKLREDYKKEKGDDYSLSKFHNELLSYGSPPIAVLRKMMLKNPGSFDDILFK